MRFEIIPAVRYRNTESGQTASVYGACPYTCKADQGHWVIENCGWTIRDNAKNLVGLGSTPFDDRPAALKAAGAMESKASASTLGHWLGRSFPGRKFTVTTGVDRYGDVDGVLVGWKHSVAPSEVERVIDTVLESAGLEMKATAFAADGRFARFHLLPNGAAYRMR